MGRGHEKKFFQRNGHRDSQQTYEKILNHQENANQNNEIRCHASQNGYYQKKVNKEHVLGRMWRKGNPCALVVGMQTVQPVWKTWKFLKN